MRNPGRKPGRSDTVALATKCVAGNYFTSGYAAQCALFPMLQVTTLPNWNAVAVWADRLFAPHMVMDAGILGIAQGLQKNAKTAQDKTKNLFAYMRDKIRYVFTHVGRGGYEPHTTTDIVKMVTVIAKTKPCSRWRWRAAWV